MSRTFGRILPTNGRNRGHFGRIRTNLVRPKPKLAAIGPDPGEIAETRSNPGRLLPKSEIRPHSVEVAQSRRHLPTLAAPYSSNGALALCVRAPERDGLRLGDDLPRPLDVLRLRRALGAEWRRLRQRRDARRESAPSTSSPLDQGARKSLGSLRSGGGRRRLGGAAGCKAAPPEQATPRPSPHLSHAKPGRAQPTFDLVLHLTPWEARADPAALEIGCDAQLRAKKMEALVRIRALRADVQADVRKIPTPEFWASQRGTHASTSLSLSLSEGPLLDLLFDLLLAPSAAALLPRLLPHELLQLWTSCLMETFLRHAAR